MIGVESKRSAPYDGDNLLDGLTQQSTLDFQYRHEMLREQEVLRLVCESQAAMCFRWVAAGTRDVICFPRRPSGSWPSTPIPTVSPEWSRTGAPMRPRSAMRGGSTSADGSFDVVLYRLVMHHLAYQGPLGPCFAEAARLLAPGGALVAIEPGLWHPVGLGLAIANRAGAATAIHGTRDDIPLSPRTLVAQARNAGLVPELHALTYTWRRMPMAPAARTAADRPPRLEAPRGAIWPHFVTYRPRRQWLGLRNGAP